MCWASLSDLWVSHELWLSKLELPHLKSPLNYLFIWQHWRTTILNWSNWEKSKYTCTYKSKQTLYTCNHILLIHNRILSSNQLSFCPFQSYQIKRWFKFDFNVRILLLLLLESKIVSLPSFKTPVHLWIAIRATDIQATKVKLCLKYAVKQQLFVPQVHFWCKMCTK